MNDLGTKFPLRDIIHLGTRVEEGVIDHFEEAILLAEQDAVPLRDASRIRLVRDAQAPQSRKWQLCRGHGKF